MSEVNLVPEPIVITDEIQMMNYIDKIEHHFFDERAFRVCKTVIMIKGHEFSTNTQMQKPVMNSGRVMAQNVTTTLESICKYIANGELEYHNEAEQKFIIADSLIKEWEEE